MTQNAFTANELLTFAHLQIAAEALYGKLGKSSVGWKFIAHALDNQ